MTSARYTDHPFPRLRYIPGQSLHPSYDPDRLEIPFAAAPHPFTAEDWCERDEFLYAVDLFNHGYWWEAHEALEGLWLEAGQQTALGRALQGVIFLCGAMIKRQTGQASVARGFRSRAETVLSPPSAPFIGIDVAELLAQIDASLQSSAAPLPQIRLRGVPCRHTSEEAL